MYVHSSRRLVFLFPAPLVRSPVLWYPSYLPPTPLLFLPHCRLMLSQQTPNNMTIVPNGAHYGLLPRTQAVTMAIGTTTDSERTSKRASSTIRGTSSPSSRRCSRPTGITFPRCVRSRERAYRPRMAIATIKNMERASLRPRTESFPIST